MKQEFFYPSKDGLTKDEAIVDAYVANPLNQFVFTVNGYYNMFRGMRYCQRQENLDKIPKDLLAWIEARM